MFPLRAVEYQALHAARGFYPVEHVGSYSGVPFNPAAFSASILVYRT
jgi:hypothetical protein